jgi:hypothetical protein
MNRYKVAVLVEYHVTAGNIDAAWERIEAGAEFPLVPYVDEDYMSKMQIVSVIDMAELEEESTDE